MHFCQDELFALLSAISGLGFLVRWLKAKFHGRSAKHKCHDVP